MSSPIDLGSYSTRNLLAQLMHIDSQLRPGPSLSDIAAGGSLGRGEVGEGVRGLQRLLNSRGSQPPLAEDGVFGPKTEDALKQFQASREMDQHGVLDRPTLNALLPGQGYDPDDHYERSDTPPPVPTVSPAPREASPETLRAGDLARIDESKSLRAERAAPASLTPSTELKDARVLFADGTFDGARNVRLGVDDQGRTRALTYRANMAIDSDGSTPNVLGSSDKRRLGLTNRQMDALAAEKTREATANGSNQTTYYDPDHQDETSMKWSSGGRSSSLDASQTPYVVLPPSIAKASGAQLGDLVRVRYGDKSVYAIYGDVGPNAKLGEASIATARALGIDPNPFSGGLDEGSQSVDYAVLPGSGSAIRGAPKSFDQIQAAGAAAFASAARSGVIRED